MQKREKCWLSLCTGWSEGRVFRLEFFHHSGFCKGGWKAFFRKCTVRCYRQWIMFYTHCVIVPVIVTTQYRSKQNILVHLVQVHLVFFFFFFCFFLAACTLEIVLAKSQAVLQQYNLLIIYGPFYFRMYSLKFFGTCTFLSCFCGMWKLPLITHIGPYLFIWCGLESVSAEFHCKHSDCMAGEGKIWKLLPATYLKLRHCHSNCLSVLTQRTSISGERFSCDSHDPFEVMRDAQEAWGTWNAKAHAAGLRAANEEVSLSYTERRLSWTVIDIIWAGEWWAYIWCCRIYD